MLYRDQEVVNVSPKALDVLAVLLEERGAVVEKAELLRRAWPDTIVEEGGLARNISLLRKELGDWIETVPKKGYRFAGEPAAVAAGEQRRGMGRRGWGVAALGVLVLGWGY